MAGVRRYSWLTCGGDMWKGAMVVSSLRLTEDVLVMTANTFLSSKVIKI
jgi:hypothetical protein